MMSEEWHTAAFGEARPATRAIRFLHRHGIARFPGPALGLINRLIAPSAADAVRRAIEPVHLESKPHAREIAIKLMDYHLLHLSAIERGFGTVRPVIMTRNPLAQVESLLRSGLTLERAAHWCRDVLNLMEEVRKRWAAPVFRFEDLVSNPVEFVHELYGVLDLEYPIDELFRVKLKAYGEARRENIDVGGNYQYLKIEELRGFVDADVNYKAISRLSISERDFVLQRLKESAARFGYGEGAFAAGAAGQPHVPNVA